MGKKKEIRVVPCFVWGTDLYIFKDRKPLIIGECKNGEHPTPTELGRARRAFERLAVGFVGEKIELVVKERKKPLFRVERKRKFIGIDDRKRIREEK